MMRNRIIATLVAVLMLTTSAYGQFDFGGDSTPAVPATAWDSFHLSTKVRVKLDFRNATLDAVIHVFSQASGVTIIKDPSFVGGITLQSPKAQSLNDAFAMLNAVLNLKNFDLTQQGSFLVIKARAPQAAAGGRRGGWGGQGAGGGWGGFGGGQGGGRNQSELKVYAIKYANATQLARVINDVFAPAAGQGQGGRGGFGGFGGFGGGRGGQGGGQAGTQVQGGGANIPTVKASADDFSNSVIVNAPSSQQDQVADLIKQVDKETDQPQQSRVFKLKYSAAADLVPVVQNIFSANTPLGRGGSTTQSTQNNNPFRGGFFGRFGQGGNNNSAGGSVVAEARTNSLVVSATGANLDLAAHVIDDLDKPVAYESSTFVYSLKNARADIVATLLNQSFGNRTTNTNPAGGSFSGNGAAQPTIGTTRTTATGGSQPASLGQTNTGGQNGGRTNNQATNYNLGGGGARTQTANGTAAVNGSGLDGDGKIVNVRDLTGQVVLVPDIDTNSVVVVAAPQYREIVEGILAQLDQIPQQVMIETLVVEANLDATNQLGVEWNFNQGKPFGIKNGTATGTSNFGLQQNTSEPQGLRYTLNAGQYGAFLQAVHADTRFDVLSTPRIFTTNNATAQINISQSLPYVTNTTVDTNGTTLFNYNFLNVGIVLTVTPRITSNGYVTMDVSQTANDFVAYTSFNAPIVNQREAQTTVSVKDGETIVLGGIINNSVSKTINKVPILGDIPILGNLFRSTKSEKQKTELLVFLTPRVVRDPAEAKVLREQTQKELEPKTQDRLPKFSVNVIPDVSREPAATPPPGVAAPPSILPGAITPVKP